MFCRNKEVTDSPDMGRQRHRVLPHLSHHAIPRPIDLLAMFAISDEVKVVGELDGLGDLLEDVDAETLAATLYVNPRFPRLITAWGRKDQIRRVI